MVSISCKNKIKNKGGVSFLYALLALLVASMISAVVIAGALSGLHRVNNDREEEQIHETLVSAAQLVRDQMLLTSVTNTTVATTKNSNTTTTVTVSSAGAFQKEMKNAKEKVDSMGTDYLSGEKALTLQVDGLSMEDVYVSYTMQCATGSKYKVIFTFTMKDGKETLYLKMDAVQSTTSTTTTTGSGTSKEEKVTTDKKTTWAQPFISEIGG